MKLSDRLASPRRLVIALTVVAVPLWNWSADHLPVWAASLVLIGILLSYWRIVAYFRREERRRGRLRRQRSTPLW